MLNDYLKEIHTALRAGDRDKATKLSKRLTRATGMDALTKLTLIKEKFDASEGKQNDSENSINS